MQMPALAPVERPVEAVGVAEAGEVLVELLVGEVGVEEVLGVVFVLVVAGLRSVAWAARTTPGFVRWEVSLRFFIDRWEERRGTGGCSTICVHSVCRLCYYGCGC